MHKVILFRGGMCGDIILCMINKDYVYSVYPLIQDKYRVRMKEYYDFTDQQKQNYFETMDGYTLSHDTDFCKQLPSANVTQLYCSDESMIEKFADRFWIKNKYTRVKHVKKDLDINESYGLAKDMKAWQKFHIFKNRFDIKNVYKATFVDEVNERFGIKDIEWAKTIHTIWRKSEHV